jgi:polyribonucleotide nucleotidyltransferase
MAKQADGSVVLRLGDTVVLVTAVCAKKPTDRDFLPLFVEYREKFYASGRIPGGFFKREGRPGEKETLTARLIDRPLRPLFDDNWRYETQIVASVISYDGQNNPDILSMVGASAALGLSDIPFDSVISGVRVGRVDGRHVVNPTHEVMENSDMDIIVAGSDEAVIMVEGGADEVSEADIVEAVAVGHEEIKRLNNLQRELFDAVGRKEKRPNTEPVVNEDIDRIVADKFTDRVKEALRVKGKMEHYAALAAVRDEAVEALSEQFPEEEKYIKGAVHNIEKNEMRAMVVNEKVRVDGRGYADIRDISCDVGVLPRAHSSALFTRGETQSLVAVTLGTSRDEHMMDTIEGENWKNYMLHYNFPSFSVGEVGPFRGPGRREIGHGALAERALRPMLPDPEEFPYTIRIVSDILESNGSSSMASVCGGTLALLDAGVPIKRPVAGIAMGAVLEDDKAAVLSDILGAEDHLGDMDFKVTGTTEGITAFQMDVKVAGVTKEILTTALEQAKAGREHILAVMGETISKHREDISPFAPKITMIKIDPDKIREIIGPGGKIIRGIQEESGATIEVEDDGTVKVAAVDANSAEIALRRIKEITVEPEVGTIYEGTVRSVVAFGAFVEILPGKDGLLHISEIAHHRIDKVEDVMKVGDVVRVKVIEVNSDGKIRLSKKALEERPEGMPEEPERGERRPPRRGQRDRAKR